MTKTKNLTLNSQQIQHFAAAFRSGLPFRCGLNPRAFRSSDGPTTLLTPRKNIEAWSLGIFNLPSMSKSMSMFSMFFLKIVILGDVIWELFGLWSLFRNQCSGGCCAAPVLCLSQPTSTECHRREDAVGPSMYRLKFLQLMTSCSSCLLLGSFSFCNGIGWIDMNSLMFVDFKVSQCCVVLFAAWACFLLAATQLSSRA